MATLLDQYGHPLQSSAPSANVVQLHKDGLANLVTGSGTSIDRNMFDHWSFVPMAPQQIMAAYRSNWLCAKIVDIPAEDMVREWRNWQAEKAQIEALEEAERKFDIIGKVQQGIAYGRLGGGALMLGFGDADPASPAPSNIGKDALKYAYVFTRHELAIGPKEWNIASPWFGMPQYFEINGQAQRQRIHPSRMLVFKGAPVPNMGFTTWEDQFWGDSVLQRIDRAVKNATKANDGFARLIDEAKIDIYRLSGFMTNLVQNEADVRRRVEYTDAGKSSLRGVYLDKEDEFMQRQLSLAGMPEMIETLLAVVAGAADIPATRLLGRAPQGMNATGEGDDKNYQSMIRSKQRLYLSPVIDKLDDVLVPSTLGTAKGIGYMWAPLTILSEKDEAEIEFKEAQTVTAYVNAGLIPESALAKSVQNRLIESQRWPGLEQAIADAEAAGEDLPDDDEDPSAIQTGGGDPNVSPTVRAPNGSPAPARAANDKVNTEEGG
jgi:phage-related protein (TIGR01555 family)